MFDNDSINDRLLEAHQESFVDSCPDPNEAYVISGWSEVNTGWSGTCGAYPSYLLQKGKHTITEDNRSDYTKSLCEQQARIIKELSRSSDKEFDYYRTVFKGCVEPGTYRYIANNGKYIDWKLHKHNISTTKRTTDYTKSFNKRSNAKISLIYKNKSETSSAEKMKQPFRLSKHVPSKLATTSINFDENDDLMEERQPSAVDSDQSSYTHDGKVPGMFSPSTLSLPPLEVPLISVSFDYEKIANKVKMWDESIRRDIRLRSENKLRLQAGSDHYSNGAEGGFTIKSILHTCEPNCECPKIAETPFHKAGDGNFRPSKLQSSLNRKVQVSSFRGVYSGNTSVPSVSSEHGTRKPIDADTNGYSRQKERLSGLFCSTPFGVSRIRTEFKGDPAISEQKSFNKKQHSLVL